MSAKQIIDTIEYKGKLPNYASKADRRRVVNILCKGPCRGKTRWAEMEVDYPGREKLKNAQVGEYIAHCLFCGWEALDPYNWTR